MTVRQGAIAALALAAGVAIGAAGSVAAASPGSSPVPTSSSPVPTSSSPVPSVDPWTWMADGMSGTGMMGRLGLTDRTGMMGGLDPEQRHALYERCDALHDAMHSDAPAAPLNTPHPQAEQ